MFAVIKIGNFQHKVCEGDTIRVDYMGEDEKGKAKSRKVTLDKVMMFAKGTDIRVGQPYLKDVKVAAEVVSHFKGKKVIAFKYRIRKDSSSKTGHRQKYTELNITKISA